MKRIVTLVILGMLWTSIGFTTPQWEPIDDYALVDVNSIKSMTVDYDEVVKATTKSPTKSGGYSLMTLMINKDTKMWCSVTYESFDSEGTMIHRSINNPKDKSAWLDGINQPSIDAILQRAN